VPLVTFWAIGHEQYLLSALFGVLFSWLIDPGGSYGQRASHIAGFGLIGAGVTALGFGIGGDAWGWLDLAIFAVTLAAGLTIMLGVHRFVAAMLLNSTCGSSLLSRSALAFIRTPTSPTTRGLR
jgi:hypothetical protein